MNDIRDERYVTSCFIENISICKYLQVTSFVGFFMVDVLIYISVVKSMSAAAMMYLVAGLVFSVATGTKRYNIKMQEQYCNNKSITKNELHGFKQVTWITICTILVAIFFYTI